MCLGGKVAWNTTRFNCWCRNAARIMCQSDLSQTAQCGWHLLAVPRTQVLLARLFVVICRLLLETIFRMGHCRRLHPLRLALLASVDEVAGDWQA